MKLTGQQAKRLQEAFLDAFPTRSSLEQMLKYELDANLAEIAGDGDLRHVIFQVIRWAEAQGKLQALIRGACLANPGNQVLQEITNTFHVPALTPSPPQPSPDRKLQATDSVFFSETAKQNKPRVFICYAWEDRATAGRLYADLQKAGVSPWMDTYDLMAGQNWKQAIQQALRASDYVVMLLSSHSTTKRGYVQKEVKAALEELAEIPPTDIFVIPVRLDDCEVTDERLQELHWVDLFPSYLEGLVKILRVIAPDAPIRQLPAMMQGLVKIFKAIVPAIFIRQLLIMIRRRARLVILLTAFVIILFMGGLFLKDTLRQNIPPNIAPVSSSISLRSEPLTVSFDEALDVFELQVVKVGDNTPWRPKRYIENLFEIREDVVIDHATGLMWQKTSISKGLLTYDEALDHIKKLNKEHFAGYSDWRLPTIPELMSLLEPEKQANTFYIDPIFDTDPLNWNWFWSSDKQTLEETMWAVHFIYGAVEGTLLNSTNYVRAVRTAIRTEPNTGMKFIKLPAGCFQMGSPAHEANRDPDERPVHEVCVNDFWIGKYEVTQEQWQKVMGESPAHFNADEVETDTHNYPVENVTWELIRNFLRTINNESDDIVYRLPTEAEWEYACRAGTEAVYSFGNDTSILGNYAWYNVNSEEQTHPVGDKNPNAFGLYDMHGNVWEWCQDWYDDDYYSKSPRENPTGPTSGEAHVLRGGSWSRPPGGLRCAFRYRDGQDPYFADFGVRLVSSLLPAQSLSDAERKRLQEDFELEEVKEGELELWRPRQYTENKFKAQGDLVIDHTTGLIWQRSGSEIPIPYQEAREYVEQLNQGRFAGYIGWRLPTVPELMTLLEPTQKNGVYIDPLFDATQKWCWSAEKRSPELAWDVTFLHGNVYWWHIGKNQFVRAVRSLSSEPTFEKEPSQQQINKRRSSPLTVAKEEALDKFKLISRIQKDDEKSFDVWRPKAYVENKFAVQNTVIIDHATGLMWQQSGSGDWLVYEETRKYIDQLNHDKFAGFNDWRLPTVSELMSLLTPEKQSNNLYINPIFDATQRWCWSVDRQSSEIAWGVRFLYGNVGWGNHSDKNNYVRAVRSISQEPASQDTWTDPVTNMEFVKIPAGCFQMGQTDPEKQELLQEVGEEQYNETFSRELPRHRVCVDEFWMGKYEVTNAQYRTWKQEHDSKRYAGHSLNHDSQPVVAISWEDAAKFAQWLTKKTGSSDTFRLPTEAEWEYAARAGTTTSRFWGDSPDYACEYASVHDRTSEQNHKFDFEAHNCRDYYAVTAPVGSFRPNAFGLYDMLGNAWEWCQDWYDPEYYASSPSQNPQGPPIGSDRVNRSPGFDAELLHCRSAFRFHAPPDTRRPTLGFRLVRTP